MLKNVVVDDDDEVQVLRIFFSLSLFHINSIHLVTASQFVAVANNDRTMSIKNIFTINNQECFN